MRRITLAAAVLTALALSNTGMADPCGMVPPVYIPDGVQGPPIQRTGAQRTYIMHRNGIETMALRPGFEGKVDDFGMLIPFPSAPAIRKLDDSTFAQIEAAVDPPTMSVHIYDPRRYRSMDMITPMSKPQGSAAPAREMEEALGYNEVRVLREEAVGMYEVAVIEAGSPRALSRWMEQHEYRYPEGMDAVTGDYVKERWCFVAIKAKVGSGPGVEPRPGQRSVQPDLPSGSSFDGHVQGMAFRFETEEAVVPMRLSVFNGADPRNVVYMLTEQPVKLDDMSESLVVRQVNGEELHGHLTDLIDVQFTNGNRGDLRRATLESIDRQRDPSPYNGVARDLFAADLLAVRTGQLALPFEEEEKELLRVSEALGMRGPEVDALHNQIVAEQRAVAVDGALDDVQEMTLTVLDGVFPGDVLARQNLTFSAYKMPPKRNVTRNDAVRPVAPTLSFERGS